jgi:hypothetical protein
MQPAGTGANRRGPPEPWHGTRNTVPSIAFVASSFVASTPVVPELSHNPDRRRASDETKARKRVDATAERDGIEDPADEEGNMELLWTDLARVVAQAAARLSRIRHDPIL